MTQIFISYRRNDTVDLTGRIYDSLVGHFGEDNVFLDTEDIPRGVNFKDYIAEHIRQALLILVMIGPRWEGDNSICEESRLKLENDSIRQELEEAFSQSVAVFPVLLNRKTFPQPDVLPKTLHSFLNISAGKVNSLSFKSDIQRLKEDLQNRIHELEQQKTKPEDSLYDEEKTVGPFYPGPAIYQGIISKIQKARLSGNRDTVVLKTGDRGLACPNRIPLLNMWSEALTQISHPNLLPVITQGYTGIRSYQGTPLAVYDLKKHIFRTGRFIDTNENGHNSSRTYEPTGYFLTLEQAAPMMNQILMGLGYLHHASVYLSSPGDDTKKLTTGLVHRNLTLKNILLFQPENSEAFELKIGSFRKLIPFQENHFMEMDSKEFTPGTPRFWALEQFQSFSLATPATDVFSAAAVFYEILTGRNIRTGFNTTLPDQADPKKKENWINFIQRNPIPHIETAVPYSGFPGKVARIINRALFEDYENVKKWEGNPSKSRTELWEYLGHKRFRDAEMFRQELLTAFSDCGINPNSEIASPTSQQIQND